MTGNHLRLDHQSARPHSTDGVNCESSVVLDAHFQAIADSTLAIDANTTWSRSRAVSIVGPVAM
jgi:hypothetical protein